MPDVSARFYAELLVTESLDEGDLESKIGSGPEQIDADSTPSAAKHWKSEDRTLSAGAETLNLTALVQDDTDRVNVDMTGERLQYLKIRANPDNTENIIFQVGDTNPYPLFVNADGLLELPAGSEILLKLNNGAVPVSSTVKNIKVTSAQTDAQYDIQLVFG